MEIQQARYFVALCETLNFTRAAERSNVTQPSLTRAIKLLEDELGGALFNRERNRTHLTELGRLVEPHIREVMAQAQTARTRASAFFQLKTARLKLGITHGVPLSPLQETLQHYATRYRIRRSRSSTSGWAPCRRRCAVASSRWWSCRSRRPTSTTCTTTPWAKAACT